MNSTLSYLYPLCLNVPASHPHQYRDTLYGITKLQKVFSEMKKTWRDNMIKFKNFRLDLSCLPPEDRTPAKAGIQLCKPENFKSDKYNIIKTLPIRLKFCGSVWIPASAGMTNILKKLKPNRYNTIKIKRNDYDDLFSGFRLKAGMTNYTGMIKSKQRQN